MIMDGSKEQNLGDFARKLRDAVCHRKQIDPHSPCMNLCEGEIRELKRGSTRKILKRDVPKKIWDHCLDLESRFRSATTLPRFDLDIGDICEFEFYGWVMFTKKSDAPFSLDRLFIHAGVPPEMIMDGTKE